MNCSRCCHNIAPGTIKAWSKIIAGVALCSFIPLLIGCLGKYGHIPGPASNAGLYKGMIITGSGMTATISVLTISFIAHKIFDAWERDDLEEVRHEFLAARDDVRREFDRIRADLHDGM